MCHGSPNDLQKTKSPRSPWRRFLRQPTKPRLPRSIVPSSKINLNRYWNKFEEMTSLRQQNPLILAVRGPPMTNANDDNEVNDNLINEQQEDGNFMTLPL